MIFVKLAVLLWVAFLIVRFFVGANVTLEEKVAAAIGKKIKMTFGRWCLLLYFCLPSPIHSRHWFGFCFLDKEVFYESNFTGRND